MASRTASPPDAQHVSAIVDDATFAAEPMPDKISAYYSLVFPNFTYYLQTLTVTIGRRCIPTSTASSSEQTQVDVDLGPLKSVSRLHARIEYEEEEERFVLVVLGRNGAWVDGAWSGKGSKVPLSERSQIQIASRTFHFVLPPPPAPEESPSPSPRPSPARLRSPSVDITSLSAPSPMPSVSPPPGPVSPPPRKAPPLPPPIAQALPNSNSIGKSKTAAGKTRKPADAPPPPPRPAPEDMPPKPPLTYAQLCYRAIKSLGGKATLQDIISWMMDNFDWYRFNEKTGWEKSVRHNLSSNRAFRKMERSAGERGKGFYWAVEEDSERMFEEQEARAAASAAAAGKDPKTGAKKGKAAALLDPPLKRSVRGEPKGAPLPPPLTSAPLVAKGAAASQPSSGSAQGATSPPAPTVKAEPLAAQIPPPAPSHSLGSAPTPSTLATSQTASATSSVDPSSANPSVSPIPPIPPSVILPIIVGPVPASHPSAASNSTAPSTNSGTPHLSTPPIVLHENQLILNPAIFSHLTPAQLRELEALGAQKALEILQGHIVRFLKERIKTEGRGRGRGRVKRPRGAAPGATGAATEKREKPPPGTGLFTTAPLAPRRVPPPMDALLPTPSPSGASDAQADGEAGPPSPILVVDDEEPSDGPAPKRRRLDVVGETAPPAAAVVV